MSKNLLKAVVVLLSILFLLQILKQCVIDTPHKSAPVAIAESRQLANKQEVVFLDFPRNANGFLYDRMLV